ncbi:MAG TPA: hypothetical protein VLT61_06665 [Anaeromyxobacteraceae bacterium]|nr:hypothetical protein [Anaeromyxobacteraceae bacterium]
MPTDPTSLAVIAISSTIALLLAVPLWRKPGGGAGKLAWTALLAVPVVGPVAFAILHDPPAPKAGCGSCGPARCGEGEGEGLTTLGRGRAAGGQADGDAR